MKQPDKIKKGLACCSGTGAVGCDECPYKDGHICRSYERNADALAYIQQLEETVAKQCEKYKRLLETASILSDALNEMDRRG